MGQSRTLVNCSKSRTTASDTPNSKQSPPGQGRNESAGHCTAPSTTSLSNVRGENNCRTSFLRNLKVAVTTQELIKAAEKGRLLSHTPEADASRAENRRRHAAAQKIWLPSDQPAWLDEETYRRKILPRLATVTVSAIRVAMGVSKPYATEVRSGKRLPHPRHWQTLARLTGIPSDCQSGTLELYASESVR